MLKIGLTGGIGSGKSTVAGIFEVLGIPVYYADAQAKRLMNEDPDLRISLQNAFGPQAYVNNQLDRKYLSKAVFSNPQQLELLNSIVHPATLRDADQWMKHQTSAYVIKEAALVFESGANKMLDYVIGVRSPEALRIQRSMLRDHTTREEVLARMDMQMPEEEKLRLCDFVIDNDEGSSLIQQVLELHEKFMRSTFC